MNNLNLDTKDTFDEFKYNKYMALYPFNDVDAFEQWLFVNNLTHAEFLTWFDKNSQPQLNTENCSWLNYLTDEYKPNQHVRDKYPNQMGIFIDFMVRKAMIEFSGQINDIENDCIQQVNPEVFKTLFEKELIQSLSSMVTPTLTLELNVARVSNRLKGQSTEDRFKSYLELLSDTTYILSILDEYPVLFELLISKTENTVAEYLEFYSRLIKDFQELNHQFGALGQFINHVGDKGDSHNNGRYVRVCEFEHKTIVYKPRSLQADRVFQQLLLDLNLSALTAFKTCLYLDKGNYGWSEFVQFKKCHSAQEYKNYYTTMGQYIALLYVLNSSDFHFENIIANGEHPILIDLESIIHSDNSIEGFKSPNAVHTVIDSLILPQRVRVPNQTKSFDFSAIGYDENQKVTGVAMNGHILRDDMHLVKVETKLASSKKTHAIKNEFEVSASEIKQLLSSGFKILYQFLQRQDRWLEANSNYQSMLKLTFRSILRPTNTYAAISRNLEHPDNLRSHTERNLFIASKLWVSVKNDDKLKLITGYESKSLAAGDVPIFYFNPKSKNIECGDHSVVKNYFTDKVSEKIKFIIQKLSDQDYAAQSWLLSASMYSQENPSSSSYIRLDENKGQFEVNFCDITAKKLTSISCGSNELYKWSNWELSDSGQNWSITPEKDYELFSGNLGSLMFLAYYAQINQSENISHNTTQSITAIIKKLSNAQFVNIGGFSGAGGVIYALSKVYAIAQNSAIPEFIRQLNQQINELIYKDDHFDVISGSAGCILSLITAYGIFGDETLIETAENCAKHIIKNFESSEIGGGWFNERSSKILGGFSHGVTGIGYALAKLDAFNNQTRYQHYIDQAFDYEDSLYKSVNNNFLDLRSDENCHENHSDFSGWCNGSLGIGLARLDLLKNNTQPHRKVQFISEIPQFIAKIMDLGFEMNDSLCHGNAGSLEYLFQVSKYYPQYYDPRDFQQLVQKLEVRILTKGLKNGTYFNQFDPGLMIGSIGLAYQLLRFQHPNKVGNVLLLN